MIRSHSERCAPLHAIRLDDARRHLAQAIAAVRAAAALDPATARAVGGLQANLVEMADHLATIQPSSPGRPHPCGALSASLATPGRSGDLPTIPDSSRRPTSVAVPLAAVSPCRVASTISTATGEVTA